jgi:lysophospholipase L1-like esterase
MGFSLFFLVTAGKRSVMPKQIPAKPKEVLNALRLVLNGLSFLLLGDSLLKRLWYYYHFPTANFAQELDSYHCASGQSIGLLAWKLRELVQTLWGMPLHFSETSCILLIGSNDLHNDLEARDSGVKYEKWHIPLNLNLRAFKETYTNLFQVLNKLKFQRVIVLSIPFQARYMRVKGFRQFHKDANEFVKSLMPNLYHGEYLEIGDLFMHAHNSQPNYDHFCQWLGRKSEAESDKLTVAERKIWRWNTNPKKDLLHWNALGMDAVFDRLYQHLCHVHIPIYHHKNFTAYLKEEKAREEERKKVMKIQKQLAPKYSMSYIVKKYHLK